jgi:hypothetical protein
LDRPSSKVDRVGRAAHQYEEGLISCAGNLKITLKFIFCLELSPVLPYSSEWFNATLEAIPVDLASQGKERIRKE